MAKKGIAAFPTARTPAATLLSLPGNQHDSMLRTPCPGYLSDCFDQSAHMGKTI
jgi:hypothetical protein